MDKVEKERDDWRDMVEEQQAAHKKILQDIEQEKVHMIDNLRKEMLMQIRDVKVKMLNMNEDELKGTTKLTVVQNAQLTGELEYQSMQTETLMYQNKSMQGVI